MVEVIPNHMKSKSNLEIDGILFIDHAINRFEADEVLSKNNLPPLQVEKMVDEPELAEAIDKLKEKEVNK